MITRRVNKRAGTIAEGAIDAFAYRLLGVEGYPLVGFYGRLVLRLRSRESNARDSHASGRIGLDLPPSRRRSQVESTPLHQNNRPC